MLNKSVVESNKAKQEEKKITGAEGDKRQRRSERAKKTIRDRGGERDMANDEMQTQQETRAVGGIMRGVFVPVPSPPQVEGGGGGVEVGVFRRKRSFVR